MILPYDANPAGWNFRKGQVTADFDLDGDPFDLQTKWKRREYIALWRITDFSFGADGLSFRFVGEPLADVGKKNKWQEPRKRTRRGRGSY